MNVTMKTHRLKTHPPYFQDVLDGTKTFEVRKNDRSFQERDRIILDEYDPDRGMYTTRSAHFVVTYILDDGVYGIADDYCVMAIKRIPST